MERNLPVSLFNDVKYAAVGMKKKKPYKNLSEKKNCVPLLKLIVLIEWQPRKSTKKMFHLFPLSNLTLFLWVRLDRFLSICLRINQTLLN